jgi:hypothetical protein
MHNQHLLLGVLGARQCVVGGHVWALPQTTDGRADYLIAPKKQSLEPTIQRHAQDRVTFRLGFCDPWSHQRFAQNTYCRPAPSLLTGFQNDPCRTRGARAHLRHHDQLHGVFGGLWHDQIVRCDVSPLSSALAH